MISHDFAPILVLSEDDQGRSIWVGNDYVRENCCVFTLFPWIILGNKIVSLIDTLQVDDQFKRKVFHFLYLNRSPYICLEAKR